MHFMVLVSDRFPTKTIIGMTECL